MWQLETGFFPVLDCWIGVGRGWAEGDCARFGVNSIEALGMFFAGG